MAKKIRKPKIIGGHAVICNIDKEGKITSVQSPWDVNAKEATYVTPGLPEDKRPDCKLIGAVDGNVFAIIGAVSKCLRRNGFDEKAKEFQDRAMGSSSYNEVLSMLGEYVNIL